MEVGGQGQGRGHAEALSNRPPDWADETLRVYSTPKEALIPYTYNAHIGCLPYTRSCGLNMRWK